MIMGALRIAGGFIFETTLGGWVAGGLGIFAVFFTWLAFHDANVGERARAGVYDKSRQEGQKAAAKSEKEHAAAAQPGAADRLLKSSCRDC